MTPTQWALVGGPADDRVALLLTRDDERGLSLAWFGEWPGGGGGAGDDLPGATGAAFAHPRRQRWGARLDAAAPSSLWVGEGGDPVAAPALQYEREGGGWSFRPEQIEVLALTAQRLQVTQTDALAALELTLIFELDAATGLLEVSSRLRNLGSDLLTLRWCAALSCRCRTGLITCSTMRETGVRSSNLSFGP